MKQAIVIRSSYCKQHEVSLDPNPIITSVSKYFVEPLCHGALKYFHFMFWHNNVILEILIVRGCNQHMCVVCFFVWTSSVILIRFHFKSTSSLPPNYHVIVEYSGRRRLDRCIWMHTGPGQIVYICNYEQVLRKNDLWYVVTIKYPSESDKARSMRNRLQPIY